MSYTHRWVTYTHYVDIETGEKITKKEFETNYTKVKTTKNVKIPRDTKAARITERTISGRRKPEQGSLEL